MLLRLGEAQQTIMFYEGARFHEERYKQYGDRLTRTWRLSFERAFESLSSQYDGAMKFVAECKTRMTELSERDASSPGTGPRLGQAPQGLTSTGDAVMNRPWTALGTPAIAIPMSVGSALPLGLQLTADRGQDVRVIRTAMKLERLLSTTR